MKFIGEYSFEFVRDGWAIRFRAGGIVALVLAIGVVSFLALDGREIIHHNAGRLASGAMALIGPSSDRRDP